MKKLYFIPVLLALDFLFTACPYFSMEDDSSRRDYITMYNHSNDDISFYFSLYPSDYEGAIYPDTSLISEEAKYLLQNTIKENYRKFEILPLEWCYNNYKTDTLCLYIFSTDTIAKYDWETIRREYKILRRYDLSYQDFKMLGNKISYPPSDAMKNIKMWPPYGTE
ncbi:hypothetical protein [Viscerimonas tarda]